MLTASLCCCPALVQVPAPIQELGEEVAEFAKQFPTIGFEKGTMRYKN